MEWNESDIDVVRKVADEMWESDDETFVPALDPEYADERSIAVRTAALAFLAKPGTDDGVYVSEKALGALLRYIVDILEP